MGFHRSHCLVDKAKFEFKGRHSNIVSFIKAELYLLFFKPSKLNEKSRPMHAYNTVI